MSNQLPESNQFPELQSAPPHQLTRALLEAFASALDRDDYARAGILLSSTCTYHTGETILSGKQATLKSFQDSSQWARANLDSVTFEHALENCHADGGTVRFVDLIVHKGETMRHECLMHATIAEGLITELVLENLPGEKEKVSQFLTAAGITR